MWTATSRWQCHGSDWVVPSHGPLTTLDDGWSQLWRDWWFDVYLMVHPFCDSHSRVKTLRPSWFIIPYCCVHDSSSLRNAPRTCLPMLRSVGTQLGSQHARGIQVGQFRVNIFSFGTTVPLRGLPSRTIQPSPFVSHLSCHWIVGASNHVWHWSRLRDQDCTSMDCSGRWYRESGGL